MVEPLKVRVTRENKAKLLEANLPVYAVWPIATDAAYRCLPLFGERIPEQVEVEVVPAFARRHPETARALVCSVLAPGIGEPLASYAYGVSFTGCLKWALVDVAVAHVEGMPELVGVELVIPGEEAGYQLSVPLPASRPLRPELEEAFLIGNTLASGPVIVFDGGVIEALEAHYAACTDCERMAALHGAVHYCDEFKLVWVHVARFTPLQEETSSAEQVVVSPDALGPVIAAQGDSQFLGVVHNHIVQEEENLCRPSVSAADRGTLRRVLYRSHQFSLTVNVGAFTGAGEEQRVAYYHLAWDKGNVVARAGYAVQRAGGCLAEPVETYLRGEDVHD